MATQTQLAQRKQAITRSLALLLGLGGLWGCWISISFLVRSIFATLQVATVLIFILFLCAFAFSAWTGLQLWKGKPGAKTSALILFTLQVFILKLPWFSYDFFNGFAFSLYWKYVSASTLGFYFYLGSSFTLVIKRTPDEYRFGVNLVAVAALVLLGWLSDKDKAAQIPTISYPDSTPLNPKDFPPSP